MAINAVVGVYYVCYERKLISWWPMNTAMPLYVGVFFLILFYAVIARIIYLATLKGA
jgi:hypothetical protein